MSQRIMGQLIRFNLVGVLNTLVDFTVFFVLSGIGSPYLLAQVCSYSCGIANSYIFNKYWTFRTVGASSAEMARFAAINVISLGVSVFLVYLFHSLLHLSLVPAKIAATLFTMAISFSGNKLWVFKGDAVSDRP